MMRRWHALLRDSSATAAAEMAMVTPLLLALLFGSVELGNYFLSQHAVSKAVRDGSRYASRLTIETDYDCPGAVFEDPAYDTLVKNVTKTGTVDGTGTGRFPADQWADACPGATALQVSVRCVAQGEYTGIYSGLDGDVPVVKVAAALAYRSVLGELGLDPGLCLRAQSEVAVAGL